MQNVNGEITYKKDPDKTQEKTNNFSRGQSNKNKSKDEVDFDDILLSAGEFGLYQVLLFFSACPFYMYGIFVYYTQIFLTEVSSDHWCWIPELENLTDLERKKTAIPRDETMKSGYSRCEAYAVNWTDFLITGRRLNNTGTKPCQYGWEFNRTEIPYPTISSELGWVCEKDNYQATAQVIFFIGSIFGGFLIGWIADRFGRLPAGIMSNIIGCIGGIITIFTRNFTEFAICRFFTGFAYDNCMTMVYLLVLEYVTPKYRSLIANLSFALFYTLFVTALPWLVLACGHWKTVSLATSIPLALAIFAGFYMPESPRWLLSKGRVDAAVNKLLTIGRINKKVIPSKLIEKFKYSALNSKQEENKTILELLRRPLLRRMFICICFLYSSCALVFDGLVRSVGLLDFDFFISFSVISVTELPSMLITAFIMDWMGRRLLVIITLIVCCIFSILTVFVSGLVSVTFVVISRFALNMAYGAVMQWAAEMLPVSVRGSGLATIHICGFVGYILAPYIVYLETFVNWLPLVLVGSIAGFGAIMAVLLPETANKNMPHSFDDAEELIMKQRIWDIPCLQRHVEDFEGHVNSSFEM